MTAPKHKIPSNWPLCAALAAAKGISNAPGTRIRVIWSLLAGYLLLPPLAEFDLPLVPDMDKFAIPSICAFAFALFYLKDPVPMWPRLWSARVLMLGFVLSHGIKINQDSAIAGV